MSLRFHYRLACLVLLSCVSLNAHAQELTGCATDTFNAMTNQALMEARRETVMNQTFIRKPDSVLHYACMENMLKNVEDNAGPIFSETDHWQNLEIDISGRSKHYQKQKKIKTQLTLTNQSLDAALTASVRSAMTPYHSENFNHSFLGGSSSLQNTSSSTCNVMARVWRTAKCENFDDPRVFYTFAELISEDPRTLPPGTECGETGIKQEVIDRAQGKNVLRDDVKPYMDYLSAEAGCQLTVGTGVTVTRKKIDGSLEKFPDAFCTNTTCSYSQEAGKCE